MEVLTGNDLLNTFYELCKNANKRFWIVSPFLGKFDKLNKKVLPTNFFSKKIEMKLITDKANKRCIDYDTLNAFNKNGSIKSLNALHAKVYIIDNSALVTSANFSYTAFCCREEIGFLHPFDNDISNLINNWEKEAEIINIDDIKKEDYVCKSEEGKKSERTGYKEKYSLNNSKHTQTRHHGSIIVKLLEANKLKIGDVLYFNPAIIQRKGERANSNIKAKLISDDRLDYLEYLDDGKRYCLSSLRSKIVNLLNIEKIAVDWGYGLRYEWFLERNNKSLHELLNEIEKESIEQYFQ